MGTTKGTNCMALTEAGSAGSMAKSSYLTPEVSSSDERSYPTSEVRGGDQEEQPHVQGQGRWPRGVNPRPRSSSYTGPRWPRGATPHSRSGGATLSKVRNSACFAGAAVKRYPMFKVRETQVRQ